VAEEGNDSQARVATGGKTRKLMAAFDQFVDDVDRRLQTSVTANYGIYRGPHVAYWHCGDRTARLRSGERDDVLLDGDVTAAVHAACDEASVDTIVANLVDFLTGR
jgi:hypothetical protein